MLDGGFIPQLRQSTNAEILTEPADCWAYGYDNSRLQHAPEAVVFAITHEQVVATVCACRDHRVPLTARGRGTGTTGAAVPIQGGVVISFERMDKILEISPTNRTLRAQAGVTNRAIQNSCAPHGFFWAPDPGSTDYSTLGGNLACNAAGPRAVKYGTARENTLGLKAVTGDGKTIITGVQTSKGVVGLDLTRLLIGSEGTLALITEATLKLTPVPTRKKTMRACYRSAETAAAAVATIMAQPATPCALELLDAACLRLVRRHIGGELHPAARALLLIEADGENDTLEETARTIEQAAHNDGLLAFDAAADSRAAELWQARKALSPALRNLAAGKINEDVAVPISELAALIHHLEELGARHRLLIAGFGHAGNGNLHINILYDPDSDAQTAAAERCLADTFDRVLSLGGTLSGEHGIGLTKRDWVAREITPSTLDVTRAVMRAFDPRGILNPEKNIPSEN